MRYAIMALSALRMSNALLDSASSSRKARNDALMAKQRGLVSMRYCLANSKLENVDVVLGSVLLFSELEMLDPVQSDWRVHIDGASAVVATLIQPEATCTKVMSPLRRRLVSECIM